MSSFRSTLLLESLHQGSLEVKSDGRKSLLPPWLAARRTSPVAGLGFNATHLRCHDARR